MPTEFTTFVSIASGVVGIFAFIKLINSPFDQIKESAKEIEKLKKEQVARKEMDRAMLNSLQAITNHMIDGNGIDRLKASRDELSKAINAIATK